MSGVDSLLLEPSVGADEEEGDADEETSDALGTTVEFMKEGSPLLPPMRPLSLAVKGRTTSSWHPLTSSSQADDSASSESITSALSSPSMMHAAAPSVVARRGSSPLSSMDGAQDFLEGEGSRHRKSNSDVRAFLERLASQDESFSKPQGSDETGDAPLGNGAPSSRSKESLSGGEKEEGSPSGVALSDILTLFANVVVSAEWKSAKHVHMHAFSTPVSTWDLTQCFVDHACSCMFFNAPPSLSLSLCCSLALHSLCVPAPLLALNVVYTQLTACPSVVYHFVCLCK